MPEASATPIHAVRGLAVLAESPAQEHAAVVSALGLPAPPTPAQYSDLFLFQLYPYASVHLGPEGMMGGVARERIAGFWRALGLTPPAEPDHLAALLGLYASLLERASGGGLTPELDTGGDDAEGALLAQAARALLEEHLAPWVFAWLERVSELAEGPYRVWAELLSELLRAEVERGQVDVSEIELPEEAVRPLQHLRDAPTLADPRQEGTEAFLSGILAPVVSGAILTRADLARFARSLDLGLRAGERRYALEHLLAQDAPGMLTALAGEVRRQGERHAERKSWLGPSADYMHERCAHTEALCAGLVDEGSS